MDVQASTLALYWLKNVDEQVLVLIQHQGLKGRETSVQSEYQLTFLCIRKFGMTMKVYKINSVQSYQNSKLNFQLAYE